MIVKQFRTNGASSTLLLIPMKDESNANYFDFVGIMTWAYCKDGERHDRTPEIVAPQLVDIWGGEKAVRSQGYTKHWHVFYDEDTGKYTFGNYSFFAKSPFIEDRMKAETFYEVDIDFIKTL